MTLLLRRAKAFKELLSKKNVRSNSKMVPSMFKYSEEVEQAKLEGRAIVALESTIITHGMPYPDNLQTALLVEQIVRQQGATPATIAILKGQLTVGLTENEIEYLAQAKDVVKTSRRDLALVTAAKLNGATTVAGTIVAAEIANIAVFVTGGIGGVHRGGEQTLDISADLTELARSRTLVVCSGVKSILDIGRTLEYLETHGVCVCVYGETNEFPAFYTRVSGHRAPYFVPSAIDAARVLLASHNLSLDSGILIAVPIPKKFAMDEIVIEQAIEEALREAEIKGIRGKEVTPFLLSAVAKATAGASLDSNIALIKNNAKVGANIAVEFNKLKNSKNVAHSSCSSGLTVNNLSNINVPGHKFGDSKRTIHTLCTANTRIYHDDVANIINDTSGGNEKSVVVIGGANIDRTYRITEGDVAIDGSTHPCHVTHCLGGVGRNIGEALWRLRDPRTVHLITAIGDDDDGRYISNMTPGLIVDGSTVPGRTPSYAAVLDSRGECCLGLGDMALHNEITPEMIDKNITLLENASIVVLDGNPPQETIDHVIQLCENLGKPVFYEPTDKRKAVKPFLKKHRLAFATPNYNELFAMSRNLQSQLNKTSNNIDDILKLCEIVSSYVKCLIVTLGGNGVLIVKQDNFHKCSRAKLYSVTKLDKFKNVSGAGDCFASGYIHGMLLGLDEEYCVAIGIETAKQSLNCNKTVPTCFKLSNVDKANYISL